MQNLRIVHQKASSKMTAKVAGPVTAALAAPSAVVLAAPLSSPTAKDIAVWKTCLREIQFLPASMSDEAASALGAMSETESLSFLIEVLCGLHSPLLGENEVFGQFKQFVQEQKQLENSLFHDHQKWLQFVLQEVKRFRTQHVQKWGGSNSYGSLLRKQLEYAEAISVFGTGHLAEEILPWLSHKQKVQVVGRNEQRLQFFGTKYSHFTIEHSARKALQQPHSAKNAHPIDELSGESPFLFHSALIISATLTNDQVLGLIKSYGKNVECIYDLRGLGSPEEEKELLQMLENYQNRRGHQQAPIKVLFLNHLFEMIQTKRQEAQKIISIVQSEISASVNLHLLRLEHRPLGWDDLCA